MATEFDPSKFFVLGQQSRMMEEKMKSDKAEQARQAMLPKARREYFAGFGQQLQQADPKEWSQLESQKIARQKTAEQMQADSAQRAREMLLMQSKGMFASLTEASRDPSKWGQVVDRMESLGFAKPGQMPREAPPIDQLLGMVDEQGLIITSLQEDQNVTPLMANVMAQFGYGPGKEGGALRDERVQKVIADEMSAIRNARGKPTATMNVYSGDLSKTTQAAQEKEVLGADLKLHQLDRMEADIMAAGGHQAISSIPAAITANVKGWASRVSESLVDEKDIFDLQNRATAIASISSFMNTVFKEISGAAIMESEMKRLVKTVPMPSDPWYVRKAKIKAWRQNYEIIRQAGYESMTEGIKAMHAKLSLNMPDPEQIKKEAKATPQGQIATNGKERAFFPVGVPVPEGWSAE